AEKLTCTVGIGPNRLIAKVASDHQKPDGLTVVTPKQVWNFLAEKNVNVLRGVGPKTEQALNQAGIMAIKDLRRWTKDVLIERFGSFGEGLYQQARGEYSAEIIEEWETKSIGRQVTFEHDTIDKDIIFGTLQELCKDVHDDAANQGHSFQTVTVKCRYENFETHTKQATLKHATRSLETMAERARLLLAGFMDVSETHHWFPTGERSQYADRTWCVSEHAQKGGRQAERACHPISDRRSSRPFDGRKVRLIGVSVSKLQ
ncbi:hypothetical protein HY642_05200, partial [Candidatus Woesearchaeota archaeon]|nr:hypothetical protein [Candidatus Woesearchaeota archaeon]